MKTKAVYLQIPENEYIRLKIHAVCHGKSIQIVIRNSLSEYLNSNQIKNKVTNDEETNG